MDPSAIAQAIVFLASELSVNMNGAVVPVDRAWCAT
jgi:NAD(P)-dependent dehydrogenase (short-subunit alcohol dehydrogenase family)